MARRRVIILWIVLPWIGLSVLGFMRGCSSAALPPEPRASELAKVRATHFRTTVGIEKDQYPVYSQRLVESLRHTGLFDAVDALEHLPNATLVARVQRHIYGTASIPIFTVLSLGIIPTTVQEEWGESFTLRRNGTAQPAVAIDFSYVGPSTLGWWAAIRSLSPNITTVSPPGTSRFRDAFSVAICSHAEEIGHLLETP